MSWVEPENSAQISHHFELKNSIQTHESESKDLAQSHKLLSKKA